MKIIFFGIKRFIFYVFVLIVFYALSFLTIDIVFREPDVFSWDNYINGYMMILYIVLILLITYIVFHIKKGKFNVIEVIIFSIIIGCISFPSLYNSAIFKYKKLQGINDGKNLIREYLKEDFNENDFEIKFSGYNDGCHIICTDTPIYWYEINNSKLNLTYNVTLNAETLEIENDELVSSFLEKRGIENSLTTYLRLLDVIPLSIKVNGRVEEIYFDKLGDNYSDLDILSNANFSFESFSVSLDNFTKEEIISLANKLFKLYKEYFYQDNVNIEEVIFYITKDDKGYAIGTINERYDGSLHLDFRTYSNSDIDMSFSEVIVLE